MLSVIPLALVKLEKEMKIGTVKIDKLSSDVSAAYCFLGGTAVLKSLLSRAERLLMRVSGDPRYNYPSRLTLQILLKKLLIENNA